MVRLLIILLLTTSLQAQIRPKIYTKGKTWYKKPHLTKRGYKQLVYEYRDGVIYFGKRRALSRQFIKSYGLECHHLLPYSLRQHEVLQRASVVGFHISMKENGKMMRGYLLNGTHVNGHRYYNLYVKKQLDLFLSQNKEATEYECNDYLINELIPELRNELDVCESSNYKTMDAYFKKILPFQNPYFDL